jgi:hypothetical protein
MATRPNRAAKPKNLTRNVTKSSATSSRSAKPSALPEWNLADLYAGLDAPEIKRDLERVDAECLAFEEAYKESWPSSHVRRTPARRLPRPCGAMRRPTT